MCSCSIAIPLYDSNVVEQEIVWNVTYTSLSPTTPLPPSTLLCLKEPRLQGEAHVWWDLSDAASSWGVHLDDLQGGQGQVPDGQLGGRTEGQLLPVQGAAGDLHQDRQLAAWMPCACMPWVLFCKHECIINCVYTAVLIQQPIYIGYLYAHSFL